MKDRDIHNKTTFIDQLGKTGGFTVPEGYFEDATEAILAGIKGKDATMKADGRLGGFIVPDAYFDELEKNILSKTTAKGKAIWMPGYMKISTGIAALFLVATLLFIFLKNYKSTQVADWNLLSADELMSHIESSDVSTELVMEVALMTPVAEERTEKTQAAGDSAKMQAEMEQYILEYADEDLLEEL